MSERVLGVDFSGAADAGQSIWLTEARRTPDGLVVEDCSRAADEWAVEREPAHAGLTERVTSGFAVVGLDFPFSLPQLLLDELCGGTWGGLIEWVAGSGPDDPSAFASTCRETARRITDDDSAAVRRETDLRRAALCPYGTRVQYQTFYGLRNVLSELAAESGVAVAPMQSAGSTRVLEVYPAATFGSLGCYREGYKGTDGERRSTNVDVIEAHGVDLGGFRERYETHHDALDSLAAAVSAGRAQEDPSTYGPRDEGCIFV